MSFTPKPLETHVNWRKADVADPSRWTLTLTDADKRELDQALNVAKSVSGDLLSTSRATISRSMVSCRSWPRSSANLSTGVALCASARLMPRAIPTTTSRCSIGASACIWATLAAEQARPYDGRRDRSGKMPRRSDRARQRDRPCRPRLSYRRFRSRGPYVPAQGEAGGLSCVANVVGIYNELLKTRPDLVAVLYDKLPWDFRGEQPPGRAAFLHALRLHRA